jgi:hypothetical protein
MRPVLEELNKPEVNSKEPEAEAEAAAEAGSTVNW